MSDNQLPLIRVESAIIIIESARDFFPSSLLHKAQEFLPIPLERGTLTIPAIPENAIIHFMQQLHQHADSEDFFLYLEESMKQLAKLWPIPSSSQCNNLVSILEYNVANFQSNSSQSLLSIEKEGFEQQVTLTLTTDEHYLERYSGTAIWLELQSLMFLVQYIRRILGDEWLPYRWVYSMQRWMKLKNMSHLPTRGYLFNAKSPLSLYLNRMPTRLLR
ncbi:hypothetical protein JCM19236_2998 [Vibrio sp. JCM 19236]|nr:hypothetical protein JCM19236_2998 [Vibrio sp. JCM 19236]